MTHSTLSPADALRVELAAILGQPDQQVMADALLEATYCTTFAAKSGGTEDGKAAEDAWSAACAVYGDGCTLAETLGVEAAWKIEEALVMMGCELDDLLKEPSPLH